MHDSLLLAELLYASGDRGVEAALIRGSSLLVPALILLAAIAALVKLRGTAAQVLVFLGLLVLALNALAWGLWQLVRVDFIPYVELTEALFLVPENASALGFSVWIAWLLVGVGLFTVRTRPAPAFRDAGPGYGAAPPLPGYATAVGDEPLQRPGWSTATWWIVLSSVAWLTGIVWLLMFMDAQPRVTSREWRQMAPFLFAYLLAALPAMIVYLVWLHQTWSAVPARYRSATPGQAVGFLFIPFFNLYWVFRAVPGLSASIRRALEDSDPRLASGAGGGFGITACVIALIPYVNLLSWIFFLVWLCLANAGKNRMLVALAERAREVPAPDAL